MGLAYLYRPAQQYQGACTVLAVVGVVDLGVVEETAVVKGVGLGAETAVEAAVTVEVVGGLAAETAEAEVVGDLAAETAVVETAEAEVVADLGVETAVEETAEAGVVADLVVKTAVEDVAVMVAVVLVEETADSAVVTAEDLAVDWAEVSVSEIVRYMHIFVLWTKIPPFAHLSTSHHFA